MKHVVLLALFALVPYLGETAPSPDHPAAQPWMNPSDPPKVRAAALLAAMTLEEKVVMLHGPESPTPCCECQNKSVTPTTIISAACAYTGNVAPNKRLGIPPINMNDGPQGFRDNIRPGTTTAFPSGLTVAASWDVDAMHEWGTAMGKEFSAKGANVQLGPGLCLARIPRNGRNFEYLSGEDPFLGHTLVQPVVRGIQSQGVIANAKHFVENNQETGRGSVSELVDERTRFEMYYPPFEGAVSAGVGSVMCSYNRINDRWSCENPETLGNLKNELGFDGWVMSDWGGTHSTAILKGLDMEMPGAGFMGAKPMGEALSKGNATISSIDDAVMRILAPMFSVGLFDRFANDPSVFDFRKHYDNVTSDSARASARSLSARSTVLLKNEGSVLPLKKSGYTLALIGLISDHAVVHGGGSGSVTPASLVSYLDGVTAAVGSSVKITTAKADNVSAAADIAGAADVAVVFVGTYSSEGSDRASLSLDDGGPSKKQNELVEAVGKAQRKTVVVASVPGAVLLPWSRDVAAILVNFMPGEQAGHAIADVLFGDVNPSAKLPLTFPNMENETHLTPAQWPGLNLHSRDFHNDTFNSANYSERLLVGYRYYDHHNIDFTTGFPFGHGLSYSTFDLSSLAIIQEGWAAASISLKVKNSGDVAGAEVVQLYLGFPAAAGEPPRQLKGFVKTPLLAAGDGTTVTFKLSERDLSIWDVEEHGWQPQKGEFSVSVGLSSRDIKLKGAFTI